MSTKQIKLGFQRATSDYVVISVKNSTAYNPGTTLCRAEVDDLIQHGRWEVVVVQFTPAREDTDDRRG
jgi:hypothetical protein